MSVDVDFISGLYNKHSCYADRLSSEEIESIHVPTSLEDTVKDWLLAKKDVVLLGNPGDGKTHLIRRIESAVARVKPEIVLDATAESDYQKLARRWIAASKAGRPFCLAINQGPLDRLMSVAGKGIPQFDEVRGQLRSLVYYTDVPAIPKKALVVDLNLRSVLSPSIVHKALQNILESAVLDACVPVFGDPSCDASLNRQALLDPQVQERIVRLLGAAAHAGRHISMRDVQGFLSYLLLGGRSVAEMLRDPSNPRHRYFNLCFEGEGELFDAIRDVFEPERVTIPEVDEHLWENTGVHDGWSFGRPATTPDHLDDSWDLFTGIKRQYFFEHADGGKLLGLHRDDDSLFFRALDGGSTEAEKFLPQVLKAINLFYCPRVHEDGQSLRIWGSQIYDAHSPRVLVSCYRVQRERFELLVPKLAPWLDKAMDYRSDHLLLRYKDPANGRVALRVDRGMWRALALAERGMPMALRSPQYSKALQTFVARLYSKESVVQMQANVISYNTDIDRLIRVTVDRHTGAYTA